MTTTPQGFPNKSAPFVDKQTGIINQAWFQLLISLWNRTGGGSGEAGSLTDFSVTTHDGIIGVVTDPTTTPNLDLALGDITPDSVAAVGDVTGANLSGINTGDVTLVGSGSYLTLINQVLTKTLIGPSDLTFTPVATDATNIFTVAPQTIEIDAMVNTGLIIKGASGQTAPLEDFQDNSGAGLSRIDNNGNFVTTKIGVGIQIFEGTNARMGLATLSGGTKVVNNTSITVNTRIFLTVNEGTLTNVGFVYTSARTPGVSFTIKSSNGSDSSNVAWVLIEPTFSLYSLLFVAASSMYFSMSAADFGTGYSKTTASFNVWVRRNTTGAQAIWTIDSGSGAASLEVYFDSSNRVNFAGSNLGTGTDYLVTSTTSYTSTTDWYNILVNYDSTDATTTNRMRIYVNGTEVAYVGGASYPTLNEVFATPTGNTEIGREITGAYFDGLIYQPAFFDNVVIDPSQVYLMGHPLDVTGISGLYSLLETNSVDLITKDFVITNPWTNHNGVTPSITVP